MPDYRALVSALAFLRFSYDCRQGLKPGLGNWIICGSFDLRSPTMRPATPIRGLSSCTSSATLSTETGALTSRSVDQVALDLENTVRKNRDPNAPIRVAGPFA